MKTIISQKLINVLKNKIFKVISLNLFNNIEFLLNNLLCNDDSNKYFDLIFKAQQTARNIVKSIVISTFEELDNEFRESAYRKSRYYINKSNVPRTLITLVGEITFTELTTFLKILIKSFSTLIKFLIYLNVIIMTLLLRLSLYLKPFLLLKPKLFVILLLLLMIFLILKLIL